LALGSLALTFDGESGGGANALGREHDGPGVLQRQAGQGQAVHQAVGTDAPMAVGLDTEAVLLPHSLDVGVRQLHLERRRLPLERLLVAQTLAHGDLTR